MLTHRLEEGRAIADDVIDRDEPRAPFHLVLSPAADFLDTLPNLGTVKPLKTLSKLPHRLHRSGGREPLTKEAR